MAETPDMFSAYLNAYDQGRELARQRRQDGAKKLYPPTSESQSLSGADESSKSSDVENPKVGQGLPHIPVAEIAKRLSPEIREGAKQRAGAVAGLVQALSQHPYDERLSMLAHVGDGLKQLGFHATDTKGFDPNDANLAVVHRAATQMHQHLSDGYGLDGDAQGAVDI